MPKAGKMSTAAPQTALRAMPLPGFPRFTDDGEAIKRMRSFALDRRFGRFKGHPGGMNGPFPLDHEVIAYWESLAAAPQRGKPPSPRRSPRPPGLVARCPIGNGEAIERMRPIRFAAG
jgi:hypothetical protein